jgi:purine-binding chemotaxis protein CheW
MDMAKRKSLIGARFLSFTLGNESYCLEIGKVKELMGMADITALPQTPKFIRGVVNLRGQIAPIMDLRTKFGMEFREYGKRTSIIVTQIEFSGERMMLGIVVDAVQEVVSIPPENISAVSYANSSVKQDFIKGIATTQDGIKVILDIERILNDGELAAIAGSIHTA